jgi:Rieske Fe-S protein
MMNPESNEKTEIMATKREREDYPGDHRRHAVALKDPLIVARTAEGAFVAVSLKCTHRGVEVEYSEMKRCFKCASLGGSEFKMTGEKIKGFAKSPLQSYLTRVEGDRLVADTTAAA